MVTAATIYMSLVGFHGLRSIATRSHQNTTKLVDGLVAINGVERAFDGPYFHEVALRLDRPVAPVLAALAERDILGGFDLSVAMPQLGDVLLVCATETKTDADIDAYVSAMAEIMSAANRKSA
jgi:glycine dehydrogenase subunit 1